MSIWAKQREMAEAVRDHQFVSVKSGQKTGKTRAGAGIGLWWAMTHENADVYLTAPSMDVVVDAIWKETRNICAAAANRGRPLVAAERIALDPGTGIRLPNGNEIKARTTGTDRPQRLAGRSGFQIFWIIDEASEFPDQLFEPIMGNLAGGGKILAISNATQGSGWFFDTFHEHAKFWRNITINARENPNVVEGRVVIQGLAEPDYCDQMLEMWGEDSAYYQARVLGNFPTQGTDTIIALSLVEAAEARWQDDPDTGYGTLRLGVDVARFGDDDSVIACVRGRHGWVQERCNGFDGNAVAGKVRRALLDCRQPGERASIAVDTTGNGSAVVDALVRLREDGALGELVEIAAITVEENADDEEEYHRLRDQLWFGCKQWLQEGGCLEPNKMLKRDLTTPKYGFDARGRIQVEPKDKMKKRLRRSPDAGDALCLAVYSGRVAVPVNYDPSPHLDPAGHFADAPGRGFG